MAHMIYNKETLSRNRPSKNQISNWLDWKVKCFLILFVIDNWLTEKWNIFSLISFIGNWGSFPMLIESVCASFLSNAPGYLLTNVNQRFLPAQLIFLSQMTKTIISDAIKRVLSKEEKANPITQCTLVLRFQEILYMCAQTRLSQESGNVLQVCQTR